MTDNSNALDIAGLGEIAKAIPEEVYTRSTETILETFTKIIAPITETTSGLGRYLTQKFDNMVNVEKALGVYSLESAIQKANKKGKSVHPPMHFKSFVKSLVEASKETNPFMHELWVNLITTQLIENTCHPHFVEILPHFSPTEAQILISLYNFKEAIGNGCGYISYRLHMFNNWIKKSGDKNLVKWNYSCNLLCEFGFADLLCPNKSEYNEADKVTVLYRTDSGNAFLIAVS